VAGKRKGWWIREPTKVVGLTPIIIIEKEKEVSLQKISMMKEEAGSEGLLDISKGWGHPTYRNRGLPIKETLLLGWKK